MVFFATPVMRTVDRIEQPSTRAETTAARLSVLGGRRVVRRGVAAAAGQQEESEQGQRQPQQPQLGEAGMGVLGCPRTAGAHRWFASRWYATSES
jgi:hypothetical protein